MLALQLVHWPVRLYSWARCFTSSSKKSTGDPTWPIDYSVLNCTDDSLRNRGDFLGRSTNILKGYHYIYKHTDIAVHVYNHRGAHLVINLLGIKVKFNISWLGL